MVLLSAELKERIKEAQQSYFANKKTSDANDDSLTQLAQCHEEMYSICEEKIKIFQEIYKEIELLSSLTNDKAKTGETYCICGKENEGNMIQCDKVRK